MQRFGKIPVSVTLTGEEWTALIARITGRELSPTGSRVYREAARKLSAQLEEAVDAHKLTKKPPLCACCGVNRADLPSKICVGCHAYAEHTA
jgi:hypothetical protein